MISNQAEMTYSKTEVAAEYPVRHLVSICAAVLLCALVYKAFADIDTSWDSLAYHLPFAALRTGIISAKDYRLSHWMSSVYDSYPVVGDYVEGWLWQLFGRPQAANAIGLLSLGALMAYCRFAFKIPAGYVALGLLPIPAVLIATTSAYNDLFCNAFATIVILGALHVWLEPEGVRWWEVFVVSLSFWIAQNTKYLMVPVATPALLCFVAGIILRRQRLDGLRFSFSRRGRLSLSILLLVLASIVLTGYGNVVHNFIAFSNPFYPVQWSIGPLHFPGAVGSQWAEPAYLAKARQPVRWLLSIAEYSSFDGRNPLWSNGDGDVHQGSPAMRMGGYFSAYVVLQLLLFGATMRCVRPYVRRISWMFFAGVTLIAAVMPGSHELRYFMFWMIFLVIANLVLARQSGEFSYALRYAFVGSSFASLVFVLSSSGFQYVRSFQPTPSQLTKGIGIDDALENLHMPKDERVCVLGKNPLTFLYAPYFHPGLEASHTYYIQEGYSIQDCGKERIIK